MKNRFGTLDVAAAVNDIKQLEGYRVANVYDINSKTYIIKFTSYAKKGSVLFESGIRIHRTYHEWDKSQFPSPFSIKLRKHLNERRLVKVRQLSFDRIVDMEIGDGAHCVHVIVELYDRGNILLTDSAYTIMNILRPRTDKDTDVRFSVNQKYPVSLESKLPDPPTLEQINTLLESCDQKSSLKRALAASVPGILGGALIEHVLNHSKLDPNVQVSDIAQKDQCASQIARAMTIAAKVARRVCKGRSAGYVPYTIEQRADNTEVELMQEYHPYLFCQHQDGKYRMFESFSEAVDTFYGSIVSQRQEQNAIKVEKEAIKKLENVKKDQSRRLEELKCTEEEKKIMAQLVILNQTLVDEAINAVCVALAAKHSWEQVEQMRRNALAKGDPIAASIAKLDLQNNRIILRLSCDEEGISLKEVPVNIDMNAYGNACTLYKGMKMAADKATRTEIAAQKVIKSAEEKAVGIIKTVRVNVNPTKRRKEMWFEKFSWFISSENYVVVSGRDATQNELLVKKYLRPEDIYVHADAHGAASVVIRNKPGGGEIPPKTLTEAAQMATCLTKAWGSHIVPSSWWVYANQVSKTAQSGEYLTKGSFIIRGKKNFMSNSSLTLGFGILFRVDEISARKYQEKLQEQMKNRYVLETKGVLNENVPPKQNVEDECPGLASDGEYPDISLDVPLARLQLEDNTDEISVVELTTKQRKKAKAPTKEQETREYLEKKAEEERKAAAAKKIGKRQKHKLEKIRKKYGDQDEEEREIRMSILGSRGKKNAADNGKQLTVFSQKAQGAKSSSDFGKPEAAKSVKKENLAQAYMEFEVYEGKREPPIIEIPVDLHRGGDLKSEHGNRADDDDEEMRIPEGEAQLGNVAGDIAYETTQNAKSDYAEVSAGTVRESFIDSGDIGLDKTQKTLADISDIKQTTDTDITLARTKGIATEQDDITLDMTQKTALDTTLDGTQDTVTENDDLISGTTQNTELDHQDTALEATQYSELNHQDYPEVAEEGFPDDVSSASTQSFGLNPEVNGNPKDHGPDDASLDSKSLGVAPKNEACKVLQPPEEHDPEDDLKELAATEGTEVLIAQLVSNPDPEDVLLYAVPMVGPYQVFQNFKYKVKLTPGTTRKGKAGKAAFELFMRAKNAPEGEKELIRALASDDKSCTNIPSGCRVSAPQLHAKK